MLLVNNKRHLLFMGALLIFLGCVAFTFCIKEGRKKKLCIFFFSATHVKLGSPKQRGDFRGSGPLVIRKCQMAGESWTDGGAALLLLKSLLIFGGR